MAAMAPLEWYDPEIGPDLSRRIDWVRAQLAHGVVERDQLGSAPHHEAVILRRSGLADVTVRAFASAYPPVGLIEPALGQRWTDALLAVRRIARTDFAAATLLGYNYMTLWRVEAGGAADAFRRAVQITLGGLALWGGANNPKGPACTVCRVSGGFLLNGTKTFATGSQSADFIVVSERYDDPNGKVQRLRFMLEAATKGLSHADDWSSLGARRTASGSLHFDNVFVPDDKLFAQVIEQPAGEQSVDDDMTAAGSLGFQALFVNMLVGAAQGAIEHAIGLGAGRIAAKGLAPSALETLGVAIAQTNAAAALTDRATWAFAALANERYVTQIPHARRRDLARVIHAAKVVVDRVALEVTSRIFEIPGAHGTMQADGLDRFWRDVRVYTLHDSVSARARDVGQLALDKTVPAPRLRYDRAIQHS